MSMDIDFNDFDFSDFLPSPPPSDPIRPIRPIRPLKSCLKSSPTASTPTKRVVFASAPRNERRNTEEEMEFQGTAWTMTYMNPFAPVGRRRRREFREWDDDDLSQDDRSRFEDDGDEDSWLKTYNDPFAPVGRLARWELDVEEDDTQSESDSSRIDVSMAEDDWTKTYEDPFSPVTRCTRREFRAENDDIEPESDNGRFEVSLKDDDWTKTYEDPFSPVGCRTRRQFRAEHDDDEPTSEDERIADMLNTVALRPMATGVARFLVSSPPPPASRPFPGSMDGTSDEHSSDEDHITRMLNRVVVGPKTAGVPNVGRKLWTGHAVKPPVSNPIVSFDNGVQTAGHKDRKTEDDNADAMVLDAHAPKHPAFGIKRPPGTTATLPSSEVSNTSVPAHPAFGIKRPPTSSLSITSAVVTDSISTANPSSEIANGNQHMIREHEAVTSLPQHPAFGIKRPPTSSLSITGTEVTGPISISTAQSATTSLPQHPSFGIKRPPSSTVNLTSDVVTESTSITTAEPPTTSLTQHPAFGIKRPPTTTAPITVGKLTDSALITTAQPPASSLPEHPAFGIKRPPSSTVSLTSTILRDQTPIDTSTPSSNIASTQPSSSSRPNRQPSLLYAQRSQASIHHNATPIGSNEGVSRLDPYDDYFHTPRQRTAMSSSRTAYEEDASEDAMDIDDEVDLVSDGDSEEQQAPVRKLWDGGYSVKREDRKVEVKDEGVKVKYRKATDKQRGFAFDDTDEEVEDGGKDAIYIDSDDEPIPVKPKKGLKKDGQQASTEGDASASGTRRSTRANRFTGSLVDPTFEPEPVPRKSTASSDSREPVTRLTAAVKATSLVYSKPGQDRASFAAEHNLSLSDIETDSSEYDSLDSSAPIPAITPLRTKKNAADKEASRRKRIREMKKRKKHERELADDLRFYKKDKKRFDKKKAREEREFKAAVAGAERYGNGVKDDVDETAPADEKPRKHAPHYKQSCVIVSKIVSTEAGLGLGYDGFVSYKVHPVDYPELAQRAEADSLKELCSAEEIERFEARLRDPRREGGGEKVLKVNPKGGEVREYW